jgi:methylase of polypeptide subunit release factors
METPLALALAPALADGLRAAGYTARGLANLWGDVADVALRRGDGAPAARMLGTATPGDVLARALYFGQEIDGAELDGALTADAVEAALALGILRRDGDRVVPSLVLRPYALGPTRRDAWVVSDRDELAGMTPLRADHVLGVGGAGRTLTSLLPVTGGGRALDLGCGCGILALELAERGFRVVATDISARAVHMTALNAALNDVTGVETRLGSLYEPVRGERFALIASNPPFVITPREAHVTHYEYRDGGRAGDALMEQVIAGLADHLEPGGQARVLGNWENDIERAADWGGSLGVWFIERERLDPAAYAQLWIRDGGTAPGSAEYTRLMTAWLDDFSARGVASIGMGWVLATASDPALRRIETIGHPLPPEHLGAHVAEALAVHERLASTTDAELGASVLRVAGDVTEARHHLPGEEAPSVIELRQGGGLGRTIGVDPALAALVGACDGDLPLGVLIGAIADLMDADAADLRSDLLPRVRELLFEGFLTVL